jgi:glycosyltransferase involved in cell wall biosynthesis
VRIGVLTSVYALGEGDRNGSFLVECHRYLRRAGVEIEVLAPSYQGLESHEIEGIPVRRFRYFPKRFENLTHMQGAPNRIRNPFYMGVAGFYLMAGTVATIDFARRGKFDLLHAHWPFPHGIWAYAAKRALGIPYVTTLHGAELLLGRKFGFVSHFLRHSLRHASGIVCNSRFTAGAVRQLGDFEPRVIPFGCTIEAAPPAVRDKHDVKRILFAGRFIQRKGLAYLLRAMPAVLARERVHLHLLGDGIERPALEAEVRRLGLSEHVTFHGIVPNEELQRQYAIADVFVLPSIVDDRGDTEGLGVVLVEALSFGTPVVACDVGGIGDLILDGETGLLVRQKDPDALARAILRLLGDETLRTRLAANGLAHVREFFHWGRITRELVATYERAIAADGRRVEAAATAQAQGR